MFNFTLKDDSENTLQKCGIYKIICTANGKFYIGSTGQSFRTRFTAHRKELRSDKHHSTYFQNCYNKYTEASFKLEVLEVIDTTVDDFKNLLLDREQFHVTLGHCFPSYEAAVEARDAYIEAQNKLAS